MGTEQTITFILKLPILDLLSTQYFQIYPLPNHDNVILVPPARYLLTTNESQFWSNEECSTRENVVLCTKKTFLNNPCSLNTMEYCTFAKITNNYQFTQELKNHQLLVIINKELEILEDCHKRLTSIISSTCRLIITIYSNF